MTVGLDNRRILRTSTVLKSLTQPSVPSSNRMAACCSLLATSILAALSAAIRMRGRSGTSARLQHSVIRKVAPNAFSETFPLLHSWIHPWGETGLRGSLETGSSGLCPAEPHGAPFTSVGLLGAPLPSVSLRGAPWGTAGSIWTPRSYVGIRGPHRSLHWAPRLLVAPSRTFSMLSPQIHGCRIISRRLSLESALQSVVLTIVQTALGSEMASKLGQHALVARERQADAAMTHVHPHLNAAKSRLILWVFSIAHE